jgi:hypothetical protein
MQVPTFPLALLEDVFPRRGITVERTAKSPLVVLRRESDGKAYALEVYDDHVTGTQIRYACRDFGLDPFDLL